MTGTRCSNSLLTNWSGFEPYKDPGTQDVESCSVTHTGSHTYVWHFSLLFLASLRGDSLCVLDSPDLSSTVLKELQTTPFGGHFW